MSTVTNLCTTSLLLSTIKPSLLDRSTGQQGTYTVKRKLFEISALTSIRFSARYKNRENIIVTNIPSVVDAYTREFKELWNYF